MKITFQQGHGNETFEYYDVNSFVQYSYQTLSRFVKLRIFRFICHFRTEVTLLKQV